MYKGFSSPSIGESLAQMPVMIALATSLSAHSHPHGKANNFGILFGILYSLFLFKSFKRHLLTKERRKTALAR